MTRLVSALLLAAPVLAVLFFASSTAFFCLVIPLVFRAGWEFHKLVNLSGWRVGAWEGALDASVFALAVWVGGLMPGAVMLVILLRVLYKALSGKAPEGARALALMSLFGVVWVGGAGGMISLLRALPEGRAAVFFVFAIVWANDIAAMYVGKAIGKRKLAPRISPGKTVEGAIGGILAGVLAGVVVTLWMDVPGVSAWLAAPVSVYLGLAALAGDLSESIVKRAAGRKNSSDIIPGHGGLLDRVDGLLAAAPAFYHFLYWTAL